MAASRSPERAAPATADAVLAAMAPQFRKCRTDHLPEVPDMAGTVDLVLSIDASGSVAEVSATPTGTVSAAVAKCVSDQVRTARFPPAADGPHTLKLSAMLADDEDDEATAERATARRITEAMKDDIRACYAEVLEATPGASGRLVVELGIGASGRAERADIVSREGSVPSTLEQCILKQFETKEFARPRDGTVVIRVPIVLKRDSS